MTATRKKVSNHILGNLWSTYKETTDPNWAEFFRVYDFGLPLAYVSSERFAVLTDKGETTLGLTWKDLLCLLDIDCDTEFESLTELFNAPPHERIGGSEPHFFTNKGMPALPTLKDLRTLEDEMSWENVAISENSYLHDDLGEILRIVQEHEFREDD
ncbi:MAG: hypothetical protein Q8M73_08995 [Actinomycetota bacterium]|nr:hypothetical protein [Actinomycetota bacterium]